MPALRDLTGQRFGLLVVAGRAPNRGKKTMWSCACDCGGRNDVDGQCLLRATTRSCGCLWKSAQRAPAGPACARPARGSTQPRTGTSAGYLAHRYAKQEPCESCVAGHRQHYRDRRLADPQASLRTNLYARYRLSVERYTEMLAAQGYRCAICQTEASRDPRASRFHVDHDHACCPNKDRTCGKCVRGLLCHACNTALGNFADDPARLRRALIYLSAGAPAD